MTSSGTQKDLTASPIDGRYPTPSVTQSPGTTSTLSPVESANPAQLRLLLVEDHDITREAITMLLELRQHSVVAAASVAEARIAAGQSAFDLVISDVGLPDGTGNELMADLRARYGLKGIALTGHGNANALKRTAEAGFVIHLTKPVRIEALERALATATLALRK